MRLHRPHIGPVLDNNSHVSYCTEWVREAFNPSEKEFQDAKKKE